MVGPQSKESVGHKGEQLLIVVQTLTAGQDRPGMDLCRWTDDEEDDAYMI